MAENKEDLLVETKKVQITKFDVTGEICDDGKEDKIYFRRQIAAVTTLIWLCILGAMVAGYSGILFPQLQQEDSIMHLTKDEESWIASMSPLFMALGCIFSSWTMDKFGRKRCNMACTVLAMIGWLIVAFSPNIETLLFGRVICGLYVGVSGMPSTAYIAEISDPQYRGTFLSLVALGIAGGIFVVHLLGTFLTWKTTALVTLVLPITLFCILSYLPESYQWYINRGEFDKARASFHWYRGNSASATDELNTTIEKSSGTKKSMRDIIAECKKQEFYKPLMILFIFFTTTQVSGSNVIAFYSVQLMQMTVPSIDRYTSMLIVDVIRVAISIVASILTKRYRVRVLLFTSAIGTVVSLFALGFFVHMGQLNPTSRVYTTIPLVFLISVIVFVSIGLIPLPWTVCGEILPPATKGFGGGMACAVNFLAFFIVIKTSPDLFEWLGTAGTFCLYGGLVSIGSIWLYKILPETKNRTLQEIQEFFKPKVEEKENCDTKVMDKLIVMK